MEDLLLALDFVSSSAPAGNEAYVCQDTGTIYWHSEFGDNEEELPEDIHSEKYLAIPHKNDLGLGKQLVLRFSAEFLPGRESEVREIFGRRGAYFRFKRFLERCDKLQQWYDYEARAQKEALKEWCRDNGIEVDG